MSQDELHGESLVGQTVADRFEVLAEIGAGGMGVVYRARQKLLERDVALKILPGSYAREPGVEQRFFNEARAISKLRHQNIVTLFDFGRTDRGELFIAMEFVDGVPLSERIREGRLPPAEAVSVADQICAALEAAHGAGIIHRDIKPDNIILESSSRGPVVRVLDFGIAKSSTDARITRTGVIYGTPEYLSPEQARGLETDARADLYAVGAILFEMLSGRRPFTGPNAQAVMYKHVHEPPPKLHVDYAQYAIPPALSELVDFLLTKRPEARANSATQVRQLLASVLGHAPPTASVPIARAPQPSPPSAAPGPRTWLLAVAGLVLAALLAVAVWPESTPAPPVIEPGRAPAVAPPLAVDAATPVDAARAAAAPAPPPDAWIRDLVAGRLPPLGWPPPEGAEPPLGPRPPPAPLQGAGAELFETARTRWAEANAAHRAATKRFEAETNAWLAGQRAEKPTAPMVDYGKATAAFEAFLAATPDHPRAADAHDYAAHGHRTRGDARAARAHLGPWVDRADDAPTWARLDVAQHELSTGLPLNARRRLEPLRDHADASVRRRATFLYAVALLLGDDARGAIRGLQTLLERAPKGAPERAAALDLMAVACAAVPEGAREAASYFRGAGGARLARRQLELLGRARLLAGEGADAVKVFTELLDEAPEERAVERTLGLVAAHVAAQDGEAALAALARLGDCEEVPAGDALLACHARHAEALAAAGRAADARAARSRVVTAFQAGGHAPGSAAAHHAAQARFARATARIDALGEAPAPEAVAKLDRELARIARYEAPRWTLAATVQRGLLARRAGPSDGTSHLEAALELARGHGLERDPWAGRARAALGEAGVKLPRPPAAP